MSDGEQPVIGKQVRQEATEILDGAIVAERRPTPSLLRDDAARRIMRLEARFGVQTFDLALELEGEITAPHRKHRELEARRAGVQHEDRVAGAFAHGPARSSFATVATRSGSKPNFFCRAFSGADAPNVRMPITWPALPT